MKIIDQHLLNILSAQAQASPRLRMNHNFHHSLDEKCHRFLNALEPGTAIPIHHHPTKDETFILLRGKVRVLTYSDAGELLEDVILSLENGRHGVDIPKNVWHTIQCLESVFVLLSRWPRNRTLAGTTRIYIQEVLKCVNPAGYTITE